MNQENHSGDTSVIQSLVGAEPLPLLATKLYRPPVRPDLEPRTRLVERLDHNRHRPLTLISAPAGYGKTILASMWLEACGCPGAWVSLDETDNDLQSFAGYLLAALQSIFPTLELKTPSVLESPVLPLAPVLARYLLNDVEQVTEPFILALDDVHLIRDQAILDLLSELLRHPPHAMHLVLIGRRDPALPIASLRAHRQVTEIRVQDLRFTPEEAARLLGTLLNREIDGATAAEWTERTEGWVTGLLLAALSLRHRVETDDVRLDIPEHSAYLQDYLVAEVLANLPPARRDWLLLTSLLDRFCAPLCEAVARGETAASQPGLTGIEFIRWLQADNLFLVHLDDRAEWFRFHHLFQQLLRDRLQEHLPPEEIEAAHRRASLWFAQAGLIEEALEHALSGGDDQGAVHLVEQNRYELMNTEQWHRLDRWLKLLPEEAVAQSPQLACASAHLAMNRGQAPEIISSLQRAEHLLSSLTPGTVEHGTAQSELAVVYAILDVIERRPAQAINRAQSGLERLPPQALYIRASATGAYAIGLQMQGDLQQGAAAIRDTLAGHAWPEGLQAKLGYYLCTMFAHQGDLTGVLTSARSGLSLAEKVRTPETLSQYRYHLGAAHYLRNELIQAEPHLQALLEDRANSSPLYLANGGYVLALICHTQGRTGEATQLINLLEDHFRKMKHTHALAFFRAFRVELALRQGELREARLLSENVDFEGVMAIHYLYTPPLTPIKMLLAEGTAESLADANSRLAALEAEVRRINRRSVLVDVLALQALVCHAQGDEQTALEKLTAALDLGIVGGNIRSFVDLGRPMADLLSRLRQTGLVERSDVLPYVERILAAFGPATEHKQPVTTSAATGPSSPLVLTESGNLVEPLTKREFEVLELLAQRLTYQEIGAQLFITAGTVGGHVHRIYSKLQVDNRRQAVTKARSLGLLPQR